MNIKKFVGFAFTVAATLLLGTILLARITFAASGSGPADAIVPTGATATAQPGSQTWYKFDEDGNGRLVTASLDAHGQPGIKFSVYTPDSIAQWIAQNGLHPVGESSRGTGHDQLWQGRFTFGGTYYLVVENSTDGSIDYVLNVRGDGVHTTNSTPTPTPLPNPNATPIPVGSLSEGGKIVFQESSGGKIYTVNADGSDLTQVTTGLDPAFSPDGSKIAFVRQGPVPGLYVINADGTNERNLFGGSQVRSPTWASDHEIVYSTIKTESGFPQICIFGRCIGGDGVTRWTLFVHDLGSDFTATDDTSRNVDTPQSGGTVPSANRVVGNITFVNPERGLMLTSLGQNVQTKEINTNPTINDPSNSPDGSRLTYMLKQAPDWQVGVSVWDGTQPTQLTFDDPLSFQQVNNVAPTFGPDSNEILFVSNRNGKWEFFAMNADGSNLRQVLKNVTDTVNLTYNDSNERVASWVK